MSEWFNAGRISPVPSGTWNDTATYIRLDIVTDPNMQRSYIAKKDVPAGTPLTNTDYWQIIAEGADGFSPTVTVEEITGGHRVTITDAEGTKSFDVMDGVGGSGGSGSGDMLKSVYDTDGSGVVDDAEKLGGKPPSYYEIPGYLKVGGDNYSITGDTGDVITVENFKGMTMNVVTNIEPTQSGSGTPSTDNARPIDGWTGATLTVNGGGTSVALNETVSGGWINWNTGVAQIEWVRRRMADLTWRMSSSTAGRFVHDSYQSTELDAVATPICSIMPCASVASTGEYSGMYTVYNNDSQVIINSGFSSVSEFKAWLTENDAYVAFKLAKPVTKQFAPQNILAIEGVNTISCNAGTTTVSGSKSIFALIDSLKERIAALEAAVTNNV